MNVGYFLLSMLQDFQHKIVINNLSFTIHYEKFMRTNQ